MLSSLLLSALLPLAAFASPLTKRDAASILAAISTIETNIATLNTTVNTFTQNSLTGIFTVLQIQGQTIDLGNSIQNATAAANASAPLTDDESARIGTEIVSLQPQIYSLLDNLVAHKPAFDTVILGIGSVSPQVEQDLQEQRGYTNDFAAALIPKLTLTFQQFAPIITQPIDDAFAEAIDAFATPGGLFALPPLPDLESFQAAMLEAAGESDDSSDDGLLGLGL